MTDSKYRGVTLVKGATYKNKKYPNKYLGRKMIDGKQYQRLFDTAKQAGLYYDDICELNGLTRYNFIHFGLHDNTREFNRDQLIGLEINLGIEVGKGSEIERRKSIKVGDLILVRHLTNKNMSIELTYCTELDKSVMNSKLSVQYFRVLRLLKNKESI